MLLSEWAICLLRNVVCPDAYRLIPITHPLLAYLIEYLATGFGVFQFTFGL